MLFLGVTFWYTINPTEAEGGIIYTELPYGVWGVMRTINGGKSASP
ncbi:MAG: hypothetical protein LBE12_02935 [Planctomycetaceae bacterium]|nr:hypothetical protein [Planctomycetaceae bacterium]